MRWRHTFQTRIAGVLALLLLVVVAATYFAVKTATSRAVENQARVQLKTGSQVFERLLDLRGHRLQNGLDWLTADLPFKRAVAEGKTVPILAALRRHGTGIRSSEVFVLGLDGKVMVSTLPILTRGQFFPYDDALRHARRTGLQMLIVAMDSRPYLLVQDEVLDPLPVARIVMGFPMDTLFANELRSMSNLEVSFLSVQNGKPGALFSTQPDAYHATTLSLLREGHISPEPKIHLFYGRRVLSQVLPLANTGDGNEVRVLLQSPLDHALESFAPLDRQFLGIALAVLLVSLAGALFLARRVSRPLNALVQAAGRIGAGDYRTPVRVRSHDEFGLLARAFNAMQSGIATRERQLAHNALHDPLTGLPNRALAMERLGSAISARRPVVLLYLGIENYRVINEGFGPQGVEEMLREASRCLSMSLLASDTAARIAGSEFLLLLENTEVDRAVARADRLYALLTEPQRIGNDELRHEVSIGIAAYPADGQHVEELISRAAIARHDASSLPGHLQIYQQDRDLAHQRQITLIRDLRRAVIEGELFLCYQPKLDLKHGHVRQAEALLRWQHPALGQVSPDEFIPLAERTGSMSSLTLWVIEEAIRQIAEWAQRGMLIQLSVNISVDDLADDELAIRVTALLMQYQVGAEQLIFEITESAIMHNPQQALSVLEQLRGCGISLSVDDFGTGYSSLAQLQRLPVQELKIDQSFVRNLNSTSGDGVIVRSTIEMSHNLGLKVVAEGVEFEPSLKLLKLWNCDTAQGYLISRPLNAMAFERWMRRERAPI
ncbi:MULTISPECIES: putative bifunctional diguanylate cyclase/phosphodiesterase [Pseudomonas]|uniref:Signal transduction GGDEF domain membrane protein n=3 Tax=Pseudomonas fluorescens group TaxID=136843 RepID=C3K7H6_PSEFS|nr:MULTISPECIES: bifunctional diguanylate cyclase/phosphodiesterase [Pseudomonas]MBZ6456058.1 EAL domain-containing protein [Pseudomonas fluorescens group sp.]MBZ6462707.1 EAL domain-containing protein [Pseudomonas fluorescens group sp.]MBZ6469088.1 EAL domain-containing protein [Pseudomonas fluorescens group sp.]WPN24863.1 EAL domain-containing protein [Pseudomonas marginalis]WQD73400.1 EAL domain-containing protein [Pseudomonas marginalis]